MVLNCSLFVMTSEHPEDIFVAIICFKDMGEDVCSSCMKD